MTFDLTPEQQSLADRARAVASAVRDVAPAIDKSGRIPEEINLALTEEMLSDTFLSGEVGAMLIIEELATASSGLAAAIGFSSAAGEGESGTLIPPTFPGLRGAEFALAAVQRSTGDVMARSRLVCCGVALGVARAAVAHAVTAMKKAGVKPGGNEKTPHWALADAATKVEAARLLTMRAAQLMERGDQADTAIALAKTLSAAAADGAVAAAIRVAGADGFARGSVLDRLARDARTLTVILTGS